MIVLILLWVLGICFPVKAETQKFPSNTFVEAINTLSSLGDRSTGTPGSSAAAEYILARFSQLGFSHVDSHHFSVPVLQDRGSTLFLPGKASGFPIHPLKVNAITPETISPKGIKGPLIYVGSGETEKFNGKTVAGTIVLMELDSGKNWLHAASLGAKALIYVDRGNTHKMLFEEKIELSPIQFPRFHISIDRARKLFGAFETIVEGRVTAEVRITSDITWQKAFSRNIYCLIPGIDPTLKNKLVIVEAFYDSTAMVFGRSPGADEATSVATLLELARVLKENPPARSVLLLATSGHGQTLAGMRELIWSLRLESKPLKKKMEKLKTTMNMTLMMLAVLERAHFLDIGDQTSESRLKDALADRIKTEVDGISRRLITLRMQKQDLGNQDIISNLARQRLLIRRLGWRTRFNDLSMDEEKALKRLIPMARKDHTSILSDVTDQLEMLKSVLKFRSLMEKMEVAAIVSLHLSSHGDGFGAFNKGWLYPLKPKINRVIHYSTIDEVLKQAALKIEKSQGIQSIFQDTLRPNQFKPWQSYFFDHPPLGGEVSALAGYLGLSFVTSHDARPMWGTPYDISNYMNLEYAIKQGALVCDMIAFLVDAPQLHSGDLPVNGFATVTGRANILRHGELFADQPASGTVIMAFQGPGRYYDMVDTMGTFRLKGVATNKLVLDKVIIEGYRFDPPTGSVVWAIDKKQTGKPAYRLKMRRKSMETSLIMFACKQTTLFNLLEPRNFRYMTKLQLIDGRREADLLRYWYSRIDTRSSIISSIFLEPGTRLKLTLSDTILRKKMILTNATETRPEGVGYLVDEWPFIHQTAFKTAWDMWALLGPRISNLERHGIFNEKVRELQQRGRAALKEAELAFEKKIYDRFSEAASTSWALAGRAYNQVEKTQKDVLFGVLFYIALFVPFAFCMERLIFSYSDIHKRIIAFCAILILLITVIYNVHPAFQLAYTPTVVILAFFIMGLSLIVTLIIFFRFEEEMILLQRRARHLKPAEVSRWKAFAAAFFLGVSNLRRRRIRTVLTCITLIILTFTIMSFTTVKSLRHHTRLLYQRDVPYRGMLLKNVNWRSLPVEALDILSNAFGKGGVIAPRVWLETGERTRATRVPVQYEDRFSEARGLVGLSAEEVDVTGLDEILVSGRWFREEERHAVLLPERMARVLGIDSGQPQNAVINLWGVPFEVVGTFSGKRLHKRFDLDGEPLTPVIFSSEVSTELTEVEMEALESGEDVWTFQSRYQHIPGDLTVIIPYSTLLAAGGQLKGVAVRFEPRTAIRITPQNLVDRFGLALFSGESNGTFLYHAGDTMSYSGIPNIIIPLLISIFIVLNTMIGSVYERKREIGIYTSVGLAPSHVSFLFIAEAMAYAVLSVVLGYLLAQISASLFGGSSLWAGITVNYSSLAGIGAMTLVILVVLVSVIYPSRVAAKIAIPDVKRSWTLPEPEGNIIEITLPFMMKYLERQSIGGYLLEYFEGHQDVSHGIFSTGNIEVASLCPMLVRAINGHYDCTDNGCKNQFCFHLRMDVWLSPFDFGIMQQVDIKFCPSVENPGFLELKVALVRKAGEVNAWRRINKTFLNDLRKQLLVWRSLNESAQDYYNNLLEYYIKKIGHNLDQVVS